MRKYVAIILAVLAVIVGVLTFYFSSPKYQIGDDIIVGEYVSTAYDAFINSGGCPEYEVDEELATIPITNNYAIWIASTKTNEFMLVKMSLKNSKYCSLDDFAIIKITDCNISELERDFTLGKEKLLQYTICPTSDFKQKKSIAKESFLYKDKSFVFAYKIVDNSY